MHSTINRIRSVAGRVLVQLRHDHRFLGLSLVVPLVVIYVVKIFIDSFTATAPGTTPPGELLLSVVDWGRLSCI
jgi:hypothetical protein